MMQPSHLCLVHDQDSFYELGLAYTFDMNEPQKSFINAFYSSSTVFLPMAQEEAKSFCIQAGQPENLGSKQQPDLPTVEMWQTLVQRLTVHHKYYSFLMHAWGG